MISKEEKLEQFLNKLFAEKQPDYLGIKGDKDFLKLTELAILLKKEDASLSEAFRNNLANDLKSVLREESKYLDEGSQPKSIYRNFALGAVSFAAVLSMFFMLFKPVGSVYAPLKLGESPGNKQEIVKEASYKLGNKKIVILLYNKRNNAILYWPFGQFAIFQ